MEEAITVQPQKRYVSLAQYEADTWIRRIPASPKATKPRIDRLQTHVVDFRQFLTVG